MSKKVFSEAVRAIRIRARCFSAFCCRRRLTRHSLLALPQKRFMTQSSTDGTLDEAVLTEWPEPSSITHLAALLTAQPVLLTHHSKALNGTFLHHGIRNEWSSALVRELVAQVPQETLGNSYCQSPLCLLVKEKAGKEEWKEGWRAVAVEMIMKMAEKDLVLRYPITDPVVRYIISAPDFPLMSLIVSRLSDEPLRHKFCRPLMMLQEEHQQSVPLSTLCSVLPPSFFVGSCEVIGKPGWDGSFPLFTVIYGPEVGCDDETAVELMKRIPASAYLADSRGNAFSNYAQAAAHASPAVLQLMTEKLGDSLRNSDIADGVVRALWKRKREAAVWLLERFGERASWTDVTNPYYLRRIVEGRQLEDIQVLFSWPSSPSLVAGKAGVLLEAVSRRSPEIVSYVLDAVMKSDECDITAVLAGFPSPLCDFLRQPNLGLLSPVLAASPSLVTFVDHAGNEDTWVHYSARDGLWEAVETLAKIWPGAGRMKMRGETAYAVAVEKGAPDSTLALLQPAVKKAGGGWWKKKKKEANA